MIANKLGKKGWDDVLVNTFESNRFVDWLAICHAELNHCGMCPDCLKPTIPAEVPMAEAA